nr:hypothetical protein [Bradyrhizobium sp.]
MQLLAGQPDGGDRSDGPGGAYATRTLIRRLQRHLHRFGTIVESFAGLGDMAVAGPGEVMPRDTA